MTLIRGIFDDSRSRRLISLSDDGKNWN